MVFMVFWEISVKQVEEFVPHVFLLSIYLYTLLGRWKNRVISGICGGPDSAHHGFSLSITSFRI